MVLIPIMINVISALIFIGINGLILLWLSKLFKFTKQDAKTSFSVAGIAGAVTFVLSLIPLLITILAASMIYNIASFVVGALVFIWMIIKFYEVKFLRAGLAWIIIFAVDVVIGFVLGIVLAVFAGALGPGFGGIIY